jgi:hypothetical protein
VKNRDTAGQTVLGPGDTTGLSYEKIPFDPARCCVEVWTIGRPRQCANRGTREHDGRLYCGWHYPPAVVAAKDRAKAKREGRDAARMRQDVAYGLAHATIEDLARALVRATGSVEAAIAAIEAAVGRT